MKKITSTLPAKASKKLTYALTCAIINHCGKDYQTAKAIAKEYARSHSATQTKLELEKINLILVKEKPKEKPTKTTPVKPVKPVKPTKKKEFKKPTNVRSAAWRVVFAQGTVKNRFEEYKSLLASVSEQGLEGNEAIEYLFNLEQALVNGTQETAVISHKPKAKVNNANIIKLAKALGIKQNPQTKTFKATISREISRMLA